MKPKGKPKEPPTFEERARITTMAAAGMSQNKIARSIGRSRRLVAGVLAEPKVQRSIQDEKAELAQLYRQKARDVVMSIDNEDIESASLQQKAVSSGILLDKSLILTGDVPSVNVQVLWEVVHAIKDSERGRVVLPPQAPALPEPDFES